MSRLSFCLSGVAACSAPLGVTDADGRVTVATFHVVLVSKLTQYDQKQVGKRGHNPYALGHYLRGAQSTRDAVARFKDQGAPATLRAYQQALLQNFTRKGHDWDPVDPADPKFAIPAVSAVWKQINAYLAAGTQPSLVK